MSHPGMMRAARWVLIGIFLGGPVFGVLLSPEGRLGSPLFLVAVSYGLVGMVVTGHRVQNPVGWVFLSAGAIHSFSWLAAGGSARIAPKAEATPATANTFDLLANMTYIPFLLLCTTFTILLYPEGLPSTRWRPVLWAAVAASLAMMVGAALDPTLNTLHGKLPNPINLSGSGVWSSRLFGVGGAVITACTIAGVISAAVRTWRSSGVQRAQMRWFASAVSLVLVAFALIVAVPNLEESSIGGLGLFAALACVPLSCGVAILRYRLYEIDRIISRTLSYTLVTGLLLAVYAFVVTSVTRLLPGTSNTFAVAAATLAAAAAFRPVFRKVQAAVDRRFNRARYDAQQTVEAFAASLRDEVSTEQVSAELVTALLQTLQPATYSVWLREAQR